MPSPCLPRITNHHVTVDTFIDHTRPGYPPADLDNLSFDGKTIIVTGSNTGLGAEAACKFAAQGAARLILGVRDESKGARAQTLIQHLASDSQCKVEAWKLDMLDYGSIQAFAKRCDNELDRLDIAVLNAGVFMSEYQASQYGWEQTLQVNTLSTTLLAILLLPKLKRSRSEDTIPVLEFVSSGRHYVAKFTETQQHDVTLNLLEDFSKQETFERGLLYRTSKLFLMYAMQTLAKMTQPDASNPPEVIVTSVCPGACQSELSRGVNGMAINAAKSLANVAFLRTTEEGSRAFVSGAAQGEQGHGKFWQNDIFKDPPEQLSGSTGEALRKRVWNEMVSALAKDVPNVAASVETSPNIEVS